MNGQTTSERHGRRWSVALATVAGLITGEILDGYLRQRLPHLAR